MYELARKLLVIWVVDVVGNAKRQRRFERSAEICADKFFTEELYCNEDESGCCL
jgi:hypothetical protein